MTEQPHEPSTREQRVNAIIAAYLEAERLGQAPDREEMLRQHPQLAGELRSFFADKDCFACLAEPIAPGPAAEPVTPSSGEDGAPTLAPGEIPPLAPGTRVRYFGDYELLEEIARGGMGIVYKARQVSLNRVVALKMILAGQLASPADVQRFHREAEAAANLDHPNIVPIYEVGEHEGQHYFSMKLIEGGSLAKPEGSRQSVVGSNEAQRWAARLLATVARAVHHAHQRGILHRDLKPGNILLASGGRQPPEPASRAGTHPESGGVRPPLATALATLTPHVTDFGLAKRVTSSSPLASPSRETGDHLTRTGAILGTPSYMAPEQARAEKGLSTAVDIYALGAILYELLTGRPPFRAETPLDTILQVLEQEPARPRSLHPEVDRDLETICLKCLEKEPGRRYASAEALAEDLERWLAGEPIVARRTTAWERAVKWARRRPAVAALGLLVLLSTAVGLTGVMLQWQRAEAARREADRKAEAEAEARGQADMARQHEAAERWKAEAERHRAEGMQLAAQSELTRFTSPGLALLLAIEGAQRHRSLLGNNALYAALDACREERTLLGHTGSVSTAAFSHDGRRILTCGEDKTARLWDAESGKQLLVLRDHDKSLALALFSPDGRRVLTVAASSYQHDRRGGSTGSVFSSSGMSVTERMIATARLWDAASGRLIAQWGPDLGQKGKSIFYSQSSPYNAAFSPDGRLVTTTFGLYPDCSAQVHDAATGKKVATLKGHEQPVVWVAFCPDSRQVATASLDDTACLWEADTGKRLHTLQGHTGAVVSVVFSPDGRRLLTLGNGWKLRFQSTTSSIGYASEDGTATMEDVAVRIWDVATGRQLAALRWPWLTKGFVRTAEFSPDGQRILTAGRQGSASFGFGSSPLLHPNIWDATSGKLLVTLKGEEGSVRSAAFGPGGRLAVTAGQDKTARIWDTRTGQELVVLRGHDGPVHTAVFSADGNRVLTASEDGTARLWEARPGFPIARREWHSIQPGTFSPGGRRLYLPPPTPDYAFTARILDTKTGAEIVRAPGVKWISPNSSARFSPDGRLLLTGSWEAVGKVPVPLVLAPVQTGKNVHVLDAATLKERVALRGHDHSVSSTAFSPDGRKVVTTDGKGRIWDAGTGKLRFLLPADKDHPIDEAAFSPDGRRVATWTTNRVGGRNFPSEEGIDLKGRRVLAAAPWAAVRIWDVESGKQLAVMEGHGKAVNAAAFSPDSTRLVTASADKTVRLWDAATGKELFRLDGHEDGVEAVAFSPDGKIVVSASDDRTARVWDVSTGALRFTLRGHEGPVRCAAFSPDGRLLLTGSDDKTVRLWKVASVQAVAVLKGPGAVRSARFSSNGGEVLAIFSERGRRQNRSIACTWPVDPLAEARRRKPRELTAAERALYEIGAE